ncbi:asparaginase [Sulfobacillus thermosulfidooxidans]|uniref:asparaginase n=1 Tax=Sulfobacillus thermosulfidooxidans TaxID=28034 RepID=UPI0006B4AEB5|nr:asparaginase [Sulfobacillus thermosulfidooxidans]
MAIHIITTGGTIASTGTNHGIVQAQIPGSVLTSELTTSSSDLIVHELSLEGSYNFDFVFLNRLLTTIESLTHLPNCQGIVVSQGTDTMEETAWTVYLFNHTNVPVVFTGAQRAADIPDTDGPRNLRHAIYVARQSKFQFSRSLIVFGSQVLSGLWAIKRHTTSLQPYASASGVIAAFDESDALSIFQDKPISLSLPPLKRHWMESIAVLPMMLGLSGDLLLHMARNGVKGIVLEGFGLGNANRSVAHAVSQLTEQNIPVVITSRCREGPARPVYGNGGGADLQQRGAIFAGHLPASKARLYLSLLLGNGIPINQLAEHFQPFY